jgi:hypothetical protein
MWLWHGRDHIDKPWKHLLKVSDPTDRHLFSSSIEVLIGDGRNTPLWEDRWLNGAAPKDLAPNLYATTRFKRGSIQTELHNLNWIRNLAHVNSLTLLEEFTMLFMALDEV